MQALALLSLIIVIAPLLALVSFVVFCYLLYRFIRLCDDVSFLSRRAKNSSAQYKATSFIPIVVVLVILLLLFLYLAVAAGNTLDLPVTTSSIF